MAYDIVFVYLCSIYETCNTQEVLLCEYISYIIRSSGGKDHERDILRVIKAGEITIWENDEPWGGVCDQVHESLNEKIRGHLKNS